MQRTATENRIALDRPLFEQREFVRFDRAYCKPSISRVPMQWNAGFHHCDVRHAVDCNLVMFHLRAIDLELSQSRYGILERIDWSENALRKRPGLQFRLGEEQYLGFLFGRDDVEFERAPVQEPQALFLAHGEQEARPLSRLDPRWSRRIDPRWDAALSSDDGSRLDPMGPGDFQRMFDAALEQVVVSRPRIRNEFCPCGSGRRFKHCHGR